MPMWLHSLIQAMPIAPLLIALPILVVLAAACCWRAVLVTLVMVLASVGGFLAAGYGDDDRGQAWFEWHLNVVQKQLECLKAHVLDYRARHGRYPTNDEGLGVLDNFENRFPGKLYLEPVGLGGPAGPLREARAAADRQPAGRLSVQLLMYRTEKGHVPRNEQELAEAMETAATAEAKVMDWQAVDVTWAVDTHDNLLMFGPGGALSPWHLPYVHENRVGLPAKAFRQSPAERGVDRRFSIRVDEGVYIIAPDAWVFADEQAAEWWADALPRFVGAVMVLGAVLLLIPLARLGRRGLVVGVLAMVGSAGGGGAVASAISGGTCYAMSPLFSRRDPAMVSRQKDLLSQYLASGAISDAAYRRAMDALRLHENVLQPAGPATRASGEGEEE